MQMRFIEKEGKKKERLIKKTKMGKIYQIWQLKCRMLKMLNMKWLAARSVARCQMHNLAASHLNSLPDLAAGMPGWHH